MTRPRPLLAAAVVVLLGAALAGCGTDSPTKPPVAAGPPLLLAFTSNRPPAPTQFITDIYMKRLDTTDPATLVPNVNSPANEGPLALSGDGRRMAFYTDRFYIGSLSTLAIYDVDTGALHIPDLLKRETNILNPSLSYDGRWMAYQAQGANAFDQAIHMIDAVADTFRDMPNLNEVGVINFDPSLNGDGSLIAFASNGSRSIGAFDILLYSVPGDSFIPLPNLNTVYNELSPSLSRDGRYIAFQTGDPRRVKGLIDVEVYDRQLDTLLDLPGANTELADYQPVISPDGRYLAYATEAQGGRDIRLYDIQARQPVSIAGVNSPTYYEENPSLSEIPPVIYQAPASATTPATAALRRAAAGGMVSAHGGRAAAFLGGRTTGVSGR